MYGRNMRRSIRRESLRMNIVRTGYLRTEVWERKITG
jgi:hypothetical protein